MLSGTARATSAGRGRTGSGGGPVCADAAEREPVLGAVQNEADLAGGLPQRAAGCLGADRDALQPAVLQRRLDHLLAVRPALRASAQLQTRRAGARACRLEGARACTEKKPSARTLPDSPPSAPPPSASASCRSSAAPTSASCTSCPRARAPLQCAGGATARAAATLSRAGPGQGQMCNHGGRGAWQGGGGGRRFGERHRSEDPAAGC